jgi:hypothetical protein
VAVDRAEFALLDSKGTVLYRSVRPLDSPAPLVPDPTIGSGSVQQAFQVPGGIFRQLRGRAVSLRVDFSLTVRSMVAHYKLAAANGELRSPETGLCQANAEISASFVRCRDIGRGADCIAATLYAADGRHNPEVLRCGGDYRPFIPATTNIISFNGFELPVRDETAPAHFDVEAADLGQAYIVMKIYEASSHFDRTVVAALPAGQ